MKNLFRIVLCLMLVMGIAFTIHASAMAEGDDGTAAYSDLKSRFSISFYSSDCHCVIGAKGNVTGAVDIPSKVVVKKGDGISLPSGMDSQTFNVTEIGSFSNQTGITSVTFPEGLIKIADSAFLNCTGLTGNLVIPNSVAYLGSQAFKGCTGLNGTLTIGNGLTTIKGSAFMNCGFTGSLIIPNTITQIELYAFQDCRNFTGNLTIPASVTSIGYDAFKNCSGFNGTLSLLCVNATRSGRTFQGCRGFTGLYIADGFTSIESEEFYNCSGMTGPLVIPDSVTSIDTYAFSGCAGFTGTLTIPSGITVINYSAFKGCSGFTGLSLPSGLTTINASAFEGCSGMTGALLLPDTLTSVSNNAFYNCGFTGNLTLPDGLTSVDSASFGLPNITGTLTIPEKISSLNREAFRGMLNVKKIVNNSSAGLYLITNFIDENDEDTYFVKVGTTEPLGAYTMKNGEKVYRIVYQGTYIRNGSLDPTVAVFNQADFILPANVTAIHDEAFERSAGRVVVIPGNCTSIGNYAFRDCPDLTHIRIPANCSLGTDVFDGCINVYIFSAVNSPAYQYCQTHDNCEFVKDTQS